MANAAKMLKIAKKSDNSLLQPYRSLWQCVHAGRLGGGGEDGGRSGIWEHAARTRDEVDSSRLGDSPHILYETL